MKATYGLGKIMALADPSPDQDDDPKTLASALDACLDEACDRLQDVDTTALPDGVQQAIALLYAASNTADSLLDAMGLPDPDDSDSVGMTNISLPALTGKLGRILALASDATDGADLDGGSMTAAGSVMDESDGKVGSVVKMKNGQYMGRHMSGKNTPFTKTRKEAAQGVLKIHKSKKGK